MRFKKSKIATWLILAVLFTALTSAWAAENEVKYSKVVTRGFTIQKNNSIDFVTVDTSEAHTDNSTGTPYVATSGAPRWVLGTNSPSQDDSGFKIARKVEGDYLFSHAFRDESTFQTTNINGHPTAGAYASYDAAATILGPLLYDHYVGYQARPTYNGTGGIGDISGHSTTAYITGNVTHLFGFKMANYYGSGTVQIQAALTADNLVSGVENYVIYSAYNTPSLHRGPFQFGQAGYVGNSIVAWGSVVIYNTLDSYNFHSDNPTGRVIIGDTGNTRTKGYNLVLVGTDAGKNLTNAALYNNVFVGQAAGYSDVAGYYNTYLGGAAGYLNLGDNNIFIGSNAGYRETGSNTFILSVAPSSRSEADGRTKSLFYGIFNDNTSLQMLTINAGIFHLPYLPVYANNADALAGGLTAGRTYRTATGTQMVVY